MESKSVNGSRATFYMRHHSRDAWSPMLSKQREASPEHLKRRREATGSVEAFEAFCFCRPAIERDPIDAAAGGPRSKASNRDAAPLDHQWGVRNMFTNSLSFTGGSCAPGARLMVEAALF